MCHSKKVEPPFSLTSTQSNALNGHIVPRTKHEILTNSRPLGPKRWSKNRGMSALLPLGKDVDKCIRLSTLKKLHEIIRQEVNMPDYDMP